MIDKNGNKLSNKQILHKIFIRNKTVISEFLNMILFFVGYIPSHYLRRFFYRLSGLSIGAGSSIHMGARFYNPGNIKVGEDTIIGEGAVLDGRDDLIIGDHVAIASEVMIYNAEHDIDDDLFSPRFGKVVIEDYVFIGPRAIILPGVVIKKGAVVAAGAVVTKNVLENEVVGGVPAKKIKIRGMNNFSYKIGRAAWFR